MIGKKALQFSEADYLKTLASDKWLFLEWLANEGGDISLNLPALKRKHKVSLWDLEHKHDCIHITVYSDKTVEVGLTAYGYRTLYENCGEAR